MKRKRYSWQSLILLLVLTSSLSWGVGCAGRDHYGGGIEDSTSIERPAVPLSEEESLADKAGEVGVVVLMVVVAVGGILLPILLLL